MRKASIFKYLLILTFKLSLNLINSQSLDSLSQCPSGLETSVWYMGKNGLNWSTGNPGVDSGYAISAGEAQTSICDRNGKLLFYSDNNNIYSANHQLMKNGYLWPFGGSSSTMNLIVNHPDSADLYYYIYPDQITDQLDTFEKKLRYALIDMRAEGGLGEVLFKHRILMDSSSERVEGIRHCNGKDWWIIGQNSMNERFWVWKLNSNGIDISNPIIHSSGRAYNLDYKFALRGYLKSASSGMYISEVTTGYDFSIMKSISKLELHKFDPSSGRIYDGIDLGFDLENELLYSTEFSPDNSKLYISGVRRIWQYDISKYDSVEIASNLIYIDSVKGNLGAMTIGPNGKIYLTTFGIKNYSLHVINKPNLTGRACEFIKNGFFLGTDTGLGSPHFAQGLMWPNKAYIQGEYEVCPDSIHRYIVIDPCPHPDPIWTLIDGGDIVNKKGDTLEVRYNKPGYARIAASYNSSCGLKTDTTQIKINNCNCHPQLEVKYIDSIICNGSDAIIALDHNADSLWINNTKITNKDTIKLMRLKHDTCLEIRLNFGVFCDSLIQKCVKVHPVIIPQYDSIYFCQGDSVLINGLWHNKNKIVESHYRNANGCDSTRITYLIMRDSSKASFEQINICSGDSIQLFGQWIFNDTFILRSYLNTTGCDSLHRINVTKYPKYIGEQFYQKLCHGDSILINNSWIKNSGNFQTIYTSIHGCDSTVYDSIYFYPIINSSIENYFICKGDSLQVNLTWYKDTATITRKIQSHTGCDSSHIISIQYKPSPELRIIKFTLCFGDSITIENFVYRVNSEFDIYKESNDPNLCDSTIHYSIIVEDELLRQLDTIITVNQNEDYQLFPQYDSRITRYNWSPSTALSCSDCPYPTINTNEERIYSLTVVDNNGCTRTSSIHIKFNNIKPYIYFPNVFSPNGDGKNDEWEIIHHPAYIIINTQIFDRRGSMVFHSEGDIFWNGKFVGQDWLPGAFAYVVKWMDEKGKVHISKGDLTLVR